jgi:hypothetical protein
MAIHSIKDLSSHENELINELIAIVGEITDEQSTHLLVNIPDAPEANMLKLSDGSVILYADKKLPLKQLRAQVRVIKVTGVGKGEPVTEYQLVLVHLAVNSQ